MKTIYNDNLFEKFICKLNVFNFCNGKKFIKVKNQIARYKKINNEKVFFTIY